MKKEVLALLVNDFMSIIKLTYSLKYQNTDEFLSLKSCKWITLDQSIFNLHNPDDSRHNWCSLYPNNINSVAAHLFNKFVNYILMPSQLYNSILNKSIYSYNIYHTTMNCQGDIKSCYDDDSSSKLIDNATPQIDLDSRQFCIGYYTLNQTSTTIARNRNCSTSCPLLRLLP